MKKRGKLKSWDDDKGFGFIKGDKGEPDLFVHISAFSGRGFRPETNQLIEYSPAKDKQGRVRAIRAVALDNKTQKPIKQAKRKKLVNGKGVVLGAIFLIFLIFLFLLEKLPGFMIYWYFLLSIVTFILYRNDKQAARLNFWRTKENTLHILSLVGGWPGALFAQQILRHKSSKGSFKTVFWLTLMSNLAAFFWLLTPQGQSILGFMDNNLQTGLAELVQLFENLRN